MANFLLRSSFASPSLLIRSFSITSPLYSHTFKDWIYSLSFYRLRQIRKESNITISFLLTDVKNIMKNRIRKGDF